MSAARPTVRASDEARVPPSASLPGPPIVVFQDLDDAAVAATFGEVMCSTYKAFGAVGIVTSGAARDLDQVRRLAFPAFSNGVICSHGYSHMGDLHGAVRVSRRMSRRPKTSVDGTRLTPLSNGRRPKST